MLYYIEFLFFEEYSAADGSIIYPISKKGCYNIIYKFLAWKNKQALGTCKKRDKRKIKGKKNCEKERKGCFSSWEQINFYFAFKYMWFYTKIAHLFTLLIKRISSDDDI